MCRTSRVSAIGPIPAAGGILGAFWDHVFDDLFRVIWGFGGMGLGSWGFGDLEVWALVLY